MLTYKSYKKTGNSSKPSLSKKFSGINASPHGPTSDQLNERGRFSNMGPPPPPVCTLRVHSRDSNRKAPHPSQHSPLMSSRLSSRDSRSQPHTTPTTTSTHLTPESPASSHASFSRVSPVSAAEPLPLLSAPELGEVQKDVMQNAAARAKQRRREEEEEREKEKERARRKAAELQKQLEVDKILPETSSQADAECSTVEDLLISSSPQNIPSLQQDSKIVTELSGGQSPTPSIPQIALSNTWRTKPALVETPSSPGTPFLPSQPSALDHMETLVEGAKESFEVVEFSDLGKFVGAPDTHEIAEENDAFYGIGNKFLPPKIQDISSPSAGLAWRQIHSRSAQSNVVPEARKTSRYESVSIKSQGRDVPNPSSSDSPRDMVNSVASQHLGGAKGHRIHKEPAISALDDAISRIKGALDGMQAGETMKEIPAFSDTESLVTKGYSPDKDKGVSSSQRNRDAQRESRQHFDITGTEPPRSPRLGSKFVVQLPKTIPYLEPIHKKRMHHFVKQPPRARWDILSFDPPVERMNRNDFSLNDVLFGPASGIHRGRVKYRVSLPRCRTSVGTSNFINAPKGNRTSATGRSTIPDDATTWRKSTSALTEPTSAVKEANVATASPTPDGSKFESSIAASNKPDGLYARIRTQPKMPLGTSVAFYRDSRIDAVKDELELSVKFVVSSELDSPKEFATTSHSMLAESVPTTHDARIQVSHVEQSHSQSENKDRDDSGDIPVTHPWTRPSLSTALKESPARAPDPEHLKAVWSQSSDKAGLHSANSLEGIADDLTSLPFTLQDVKSEDGETPPPSVSVVPSRMSLHDVTKAFQQVPPSSSSSSPAPLRTPSVSSSPVARAPCYPYGNTLRPQYYTSPMMNHAHSTSAVYPPPVPPSPIPSRMAVNNHTPLYSQPMWVSMSAPATQNHGSMMRSIVSPYPGQIVPFRSPGTSYTSQLPLNVPTPSSQQQAGGQINRDRNMPVISPALPPPAPAMYGSPMLIHPHVMPAPHSQGYVLPPTGRQVTTENGQAALQHSQPSGNHEPTNFNAVAPFVRSAW